MFVALFSTLNPGDEVIAADPHYRVYDEVIAMCGATVSVVPTIEETGFQIDTDALEAAITPRTRAILVVSPDNPTGSVQNRQTAERIAAIAREHDLLVYSDELYERFIFDGAEHVSFAALPEMHERTITINGFSKAYAMTGWRVGYLGVPAALKPAMTTVKHATSICAAAPSQIAALAILEGPQEPLQQMMAEWTAAPQLPLRPSRRHGGATDSHPRRLLRLLRRLSVRHERHRVCRGLCRGRAGAGWLRGRVRTRGRSLRPRLLHAAHA